MTKQCQQVSVWRQTTNIFSLLWNQSKGLIEYTWQTYLDDVNQGILSVPGIAGYEWVPARIGRFYKYKIFFIIPMAN